jgi:hypothetical protein
MKNAYFVSSLEAQKFFDGDHSIYYYAKRRNALL